MKLITRVTENGRQKFILADEDGEPITLVIYYAPTQQNWLCNITWKEFVANGISLVRSPNVLRAFKNILSFGLMVDTTDGFDPFYITDFKLGRANLYLLNRFDLSQIEEKIYG
jgi:hypothetical protein